MNKYVCYCTLMNGDTESRWVEASSKEEAESIIRDEYWDIKSIDLIRKI